MTAKELIKALKEVKPDAKVVLEIGDEYHEVDDFYTTIDEYIKAGEEDQGGGSKRIRDLIVIV